METKKCKYCQSDIPKAAKVCPQCARKQGGKAKWIVLAVVLLLILGAVAGGGSGDKDSASESNPQKVETAANETTETNDSAGAESTSEEAGSSASTAFRPGDIIDISTAKITYVSAEEYQTNNEFMQPKEGNVYYRIELEFENTGDSDFSVTMYSFNGYADGYSMDAAYFDDDLSLDLSPGKKGIGAVYFEGPADAAEVTVEYETNFWTENKIELIVKE